MDKNRTFLEEAIKGIFEGNTSNAGLDTIVTKIKDLIKDLDKGDRDYVFNSLGYFKGK